LVVSDLERARKFYLEVLGATEYRQYGGSSSVMQFQKSWLLLVTSGGPTADKPDVLFEPPTEPNRISHSMTIRVPDCQEAYEVLKSRGAEFLTPPYDWGAEARCFFGDPDGHLFEISQAS
jgi:catechol 2,3-dioxygenase-like lactoylglutathione lyase family enzyme